MAKKKTAIETAEISELNQPEGLLFEQALERLESIVRQLEFENLNLDDSLALFQEGVSLSRYCQQKLGEAETKIDLLICGKDGKLDLKPVILAEQGRNGE